MANIDNLPIDINSNKLCDWVISRRHCERTWFDQAQNIRIKLNEALKQLPENDKIKEITSLVPITYYQCLEIFDVLKETEKSSRNMLGFYSSQIYKTFTNIIAAYENKNIYLGEGSQILQRLIQFELPHLKKVITKTENDIESYYKKHASYGKLALDKKRMYEKELEKMGLKGENLKNELLMLTLELPEFWAKIAADILQLKTLVSYFKEFSSFSLGDNQYLSLPLITLILEKGADVTVYEWKNKKPPTLIEKPDFNSKFEETIKEDENDEIDFGDDDEIDFGDDIEIEVVGDNNGDVEDGVARGDDALTILENPETNRLILEELRALSYFLEFRIFDDTNETPADVYITGLAEANVLKSLSLGELKAYKEIVDNLILKLTDEQKLYLFKIKSSPHFVNVIVEDLTEKRNMEGKMISLQRNIDSLIENSKKTLLNAKEEYEKTKKIVKYLKDHIEKSISEKYSNRPVNIMGEINVILSQS
uniref:CDK5RAP3-like protein n=1 Tax=Strongyloides papillosus TaxID=174720 RepID=A0A0N5CD12_STREA